MLVMCPNEIINPTWMGMNYLGLFKASECKISTLQNVLINIQVKSISAQLPE